MAAAQAHAVIDRVVERSFVVPAGAIPTLDVESFYGAIKISTSPDAAVRVVVRETIEADSESQADRDLRDLDLDIKEQAAPGAENVTVRAAYRRTIHWTWEKWPPLGLAFEMEIPARCQLRVVSREGAVTIPAITGDVDVRAQNGEIFIGAIKGSANVKSGAGNVTVTSCTGPLTIDAHSGNLLVGTLQSSGQIDAVGGTVEVQASHGDLHVRGDGSDVHVGFVYPLRGDADVRASGGDVEATFEANVRANLDIHASTFGQVRVRDLPIESATGKAGDAHVAGALNGGGSRVEIRASGGNVRLRGVPAMK